MKKDFFKYGNLTALIVVLAINALAAFGILGGITTREVSYMYKSLLTPADYAFSIWSIIYIMLAVMVYLQINNEDLRDSIGWWFIISCILNIAWIFAWQFRKIGLSFILITVLLADLIILINKAKDEGVFTKMSVGIYTGWINVAMLANLGALFVRYDWEIFGISSTVWAVIALFFGLLWICFFLNGSSNIYYAVGAIWGYLGIVLATDINLIQITALICVCIFVINIFLIICRKKVDVLENY